MKTNKEMNKENMEELLRLRKECVETENTLRYAEMLIAETLKDKAISDDSLFVHLIPIVMNFAPNGKMPPFPFTSREIIFKTFLSLLRDPEVFSLNRPDDCFWARTKGYLEYLQLVDKENPKAEGDNNI